MTPVYDDPRMRAQELDLAIADVLRYSMLATVAPNPAENIDKISESINGLREVFGSTIDINELIGALVRTTTDFNSSFNDAGPFDIDQMDTILTSAMRATAATLEKSIPAKSRAARYRGEITSSLVEFRNQHRR